MKIAIQGEEGSFHAVAARQYFHNHKIEIVPCSTFDMTLQAVKDKDADYALMAVENARAGSILYNYTLIRESGMKMLGEHNLRVKQNLMALPGQTIGDIREIRSHPIALSQCMAFLNKHPEITLVESDDTAGFARIIKEKGLKGVAAIASTNAASLYALNIIAPGIETYKMNYTKFVIVGDKNIENKPGNKASICFSVKHDPGMLASVLVKLAELGINLSKIQSVPNMTDKWGYMFYLDLELAHNSKIDFVSKELDKYTIGLQILGIYTKGEMLYES
jgi:prephenate dehydratase